MEEGLIILLIPPSLLFSFSILLSLLLYMFHFIGFAFLYVA